MQPILSDKKRNRNQKKNESCEETLIFSGGYANWLNGQPNNHQRYQTCAAIEVDDRYSFNDIKCMERLGTICQIPGGEYIKCMERLGTICQIPGGEYIKSSERLGTICQITGGVHQVYGQTGNHLSDNWGSTSSLWTDWAQSVR